VKNAQNVIKPDKTGTTGQKIARVVQYVVKPKQPRTILQPGQ
jgi:hypothetical protein